MKSKLLILIMIIAVMLSLFAVPVMADSKVVDITSPESSQVVYKEIFSICGICVYDETTIEFFYKDRKTDKYEPLYTTEGESNFKVGNSKIFGKSVKLKDKGENAIRIISYTKATKDEPQINDYTITLGEEKKGNWFTESITDIGNSIKTWLDKK